jgi:hypothetical protein
LSVRDPKAEEEGSFMNFKMIRHAAVCLAVAVVPGLVFGNPIAPLDACDGIVEFDGRHYELVAHNGISWESASDIAAGKKFDGVDGHLATITSAAEDVFVESLRKCARTRTTNKLGREAVWVGGIQQLQAAEPGGGWEWVNNEGPISTPDFPLSSYSNWLTNPDGSPKEPNNTNNNEQHLTVGHTGKFGWNDEGNLGNIGGYVIEYDTARIVDPGECIEGEGCVTTAGQALLLPPVTLGEDAAIGVRTYEFTDDPERCGVDPLILFGGNDPRPELHIPPYLCGSPKFIVVELKRAGFEIQQGTILIENEPLEALPGNWYECTGPKEGLTPSLDPQQRDVVAWQATDFGDMLENDLGGTAGADFVGALGEFTFECGSSRGLTKNMSYLVIGMHINFGLNFDTHSDAVHERFVALTRYKLKLLQASVTESRIALRTIDYLLLRTHVQSALWLHDRGDFAKAEAVIRLFLRRAEAATYRTIEGENYGGEHLMRARNIKFMYEEKVIPYAP